MNHILLPFLCVLLFMMGCFGNNNDTNVPQYEIDSLYDLYNSTNGAEWFWRSDGVHWNFSGDPNPCQDWQGIYCSEDVPGSDYRHVSKLLLSNFNLDGTLPSSIGNLTQLQQLNLDANSLYGTIPKEIGLHMHNLTYLSIQDSYMEGRIPVSIGMLSELTFLALCDSEYSGALPDSLGNLQKLRILRIEETLVRGTIPASFGQLRNLTELSLDLNALRGSIPANLGSLTNLEKFDVSFNKLEGSLPSEIFSNLTSLLYLRISANIISGTIPANIGRLKSLKSLELDRNRLTGRIPQSITELTEMTVFSLYTNKLTGSIPEDLGNLTKVRMFMLYENQLSGSIPAALGNITQIIYLDLFDNKLIGTLPHSLTKLSKMNYCDLHKNLLTGTVMDDWFGMSALIYLDLSTNSITSTLPSAMCNDSTMTNLYLEENKLTGTIPACIGNMGAMRILFLEDNQLSGPIPLSFCEIPDIYLLTLSANRYTGQIPACIGNLSGLITFYASDNMLTGPLPSSIGGMIYLNQLDLATNAITGTLPNAIRNMHSAYAFSLYGNYLTGSIPDGLWEMSRLSQLFLSNNSLTGTLSKSINATPSLTDVGLRLNYFSGNLPEELTGLINLEYLDVGINLITGTLPALFTQSTYLGTLDVHSNYMTGCLPPFGNLLRLRSLQFMNNRFGCSLDGVFSGEQQPELVDVDISYNQFTGTIPVELLQLPELITAVATSNCFTGTLPQEICNMKKLEYLILDGLHASPHCRKRISLISNSYTVKNGLSGTIPPCALSMPNLTYFHLSGNALTGTLPGTLNFSEKVTQLILSHNSLTGTIPEALQTHKWSLFDVSYNLISGTLLSEFGERLDSNASVYVQNNRLSGKIPSSLVSLESISTLGSNMFSCDIDKAELPEHDENKENYQCGSDDFNAPYYALISAIVVLFALLGYVYVYGINIELFRSMQSYVHKWLLPKASLPLRCQHFYSMIEILCRLGVYCAAVILIVLVPWYVTASHYWGTYTHQYAWMVSAAFLSGFSAGLIEFVLLTALMATVLAFTVYFTFYRNREELLFSDEESINKTTEQSFFRRILKKCAVYGAFLIVNFTIVVGMNVVFVVVYLTQNSAVLTLFQILMSLFKFFWNAVCARRLAALAAQGTGQKDHSAGFFTLQVFIGLFNNIAVPCLVVAVLSPSCFYSVFNSPSAVSSEYIGYGCIYIPPYFQCFEEVETSTYDPPFTYDYQCSSSFITFYAAPFVYLAIAAGIVTPFGNLALSWIHQHTNEDNTLHKFCEVVLPKLLKPFNLEPPNEELRTKPFVDPNYLLAVIFIYFGIMMTFGVVFPPIAAAMCFTMLSVSWQVKLAVGRLIFNAREASALYVVSAVEQECTGSAFLDKLRGGMLMIVAFGFGFYALFVFDTIGDSEGLQRAYWVLIVMPLISLFLFAAVRIRRNYLTRHLSNRENNNNNNEKNRDSIIDKAIIPENPHSMITTDNVLHSRSAEADL